MFQTIQKNQKLIQIAMSLLFIPLVFGGLSTSVQNYGRAPIVAELGDDSIDLQQFEKSYTAAKEEERKRLGDAYNEAAYNTDEKRLQHLNVMVDRALLKHTVTTENLLATDTAVAQYLKDDPSMPKNAQGAIDTAELAKILKSQKISEQAFLDGNRRTLSEMNVSQPLTFGLDLLPFQKSAVKDVFSKMQTVENKAVDMAPYLAAISITPAAVKEYYDAHQAEFTRAATFDLEYAFMPLNQTAYVPTDEDIRKFATAGGATQPTAADLVQFRQDPIKVKALAQKVLLEKLAASVAQASAANPKDMDALVAKYAVKKETFAGLTRTSSANLPDALKNPAVRSALANGEMAASNAISQPMPMNGGVLVGRVVKSTAPGLQPLDLVANEVEAKLKNKAALAKMTQEYQEKLPKMAATTPLAAPMRVGFFNQDSLSNITLGKVMATSTYPALFLNQTDTSIGLVRLVGAAPALTLSEEELKQTYNGMASYDAQLQSRAFLDTLRQRYGVKLFATKLNANVDAKSPT
jgi:peptidyl-prolyl cis-trans isomerase D